MLNNLEKAGDQDYAVRPGGDVPDNAVHDGGFEVHEFFLQVFVRGLYLRGGGGSVLDRLYVQN